MALSHRSFTRFSLIGCFAAVLFAEPCPGCQPPTVPEPKPGEFVAEAVPADIQAVIESKAQLPGSSETKGVPPESKAIVQDTRKLWPVGYTIRVSFLGGTPEARKKIARYAAGWTEAGANLKFDFGQTSPDGDCRVYRRGDRSQVRISFSRPGYFSLIGTDCTNAPEPMETMNFHQFDINPPNETMFKTIVLHEFGHLIGLSHEHQHHRIDCDWNWQVLYRELAGPPNNWSRQQIDFNMKQINYLTNPRITATPHDKKSIMHYSFPARYFNSENSPCHIPQNSELSDTDKAAARTLYPQESARSLEQMNALAAARDMAPAEARDGIEARLRLFREPSGGSGPNETPPNPTSGPAPVARDAAAPAGASRQIAKKLALLVGVNDCPAATPLKGAANDVMSMKRLLTTKFEFAPENVVVLLNKDATRAAIVGAFQDHLIAKADKDSIVVFHFSGHGDQVLDEPDGDEVDGLDETIVPYDGDLNGRGHIKDDELKVLFDGLTKKTKNVTFIMDCCHSGTNSRAVATPRRMNRTDAQLREREAEVRRLLQARGSAGRCDRGARRRRPRRARPPGRLARADQRPPAGLHAERRPDQLVPGQR